MEQNFEDRGFDVRVVLQRCLEASVSIDGKLVGEIGQGLLILLGVGHDDGQTDVDWMCKKIANLRVFEDEEGKMNRSVLDVGGATLVVSQFTLYGNCRKGRRPSFVHAGHPTIAEPLVDQFCTALSDLGIQDVQTGRFGADMKVQLINDGPVTLIIDSP